MSSLGSNPVRPVARGRLIVRVCSPPIIESNKPEGFVYPAGESPLESLFPHNPILSEIVEFLPTPSMLALYYTSTTTHYYLHSQSRFFRNLAIVGEGHSEKWVTQKKGCAVRDLPNMLVSLYEGEPIRDDFLGDDAHNHSENRKLNEWLARAGLMRVKKDCDCGEDHDGYHEEPLPKPVYYSRLMGRHLFMMLNNYPIGRRLTTLVIDGTSVETDSLKIVLMKMEGSLRGVSAKHCPNIECFMWSEWLLEALYEARPLGLEWLRIYGSGNSPTSHFTWNKLPDQLTPLPRHRLDPELPGIDLDNYVPKPKLFANVIPFIFHYNFTAWMITPLHLYGEKRREFFAAVRMAMVGQRQTWLRMNPRPEYWNPPSEFLHDPHPLIALISFAKYRGIRLDVEYCVSREFCFSFLYGRPEILPPNPPVGIQPMHITLFNNHTGQPTICVGNVPDQPTSHRLHTHCVAEVGRRRETGGGTCTNCGLWEDMPSPEAFRKPGPVIEVGGIRIGGPIGIGRIAIGSLCSNCIVNMTCGSCNAFYCGSCLFRPPGPPMPLNPTAHEPPNPKFLTIVCSSNIHGPYCKGCIKENVIECIDCFQKTCKWCMTPDHTMIKTDLFGRDLKLHERYGVIKPLRNTRAGRMSGWDERVDKEDGLQYSYYKLDDPSEYTDSSLDGEYEEYSDELDRMDITSDDQPRSSPPPRPVECEENGYENDVDMDAGRDIDTSEDGGANPNSASGGVHGHSVNLPPPAKPEPPPLLLTTRIFEQCTECKLAVCSYCLNYDENLTSHRKYSEYQSCNGSCGRRFCGLCFRKERPKLQICKDCGLVMCNPCCLRQGMLEPTYYLGDRDSTFRREISEDGSGRYAWWWCPDCTIKGGG